MPSRRTLLFFSLIPAGAALPALAQEGFSLFTTDFPRAEFAARRASVFDAITFSDPDRHSR